MSTLWFAKKTQSQVTRKFAFAAAAGLVAGFGASAQAQSTWNGTTSGNWNNAASWNGGAGPVPTSGDTASLVFNSNGAASYTATNDIATSPFVLNSLTLNNSGTGTMTLAGNPLSFGGTNPTLTATGSSIISAVLVGDANSVFTMNGTGTVTQSSNSSGFLGTVIINGGRLASNNIAGTHNFNPKSIVVNNGGTYAFGGGTDPNLPASTYVTVNTGGNLIWTTGEQFGGVILDGGTVSASSGLTAQGALSELRTGTINRTSGTPALGTASASAIWRKTTTGTVTVNGLPFAGTGSLKIDNGVLELDTAPTVTTVTLGGGVAEGSTAATYRHIGGSATMARPINVQVGNGTIDIQSPTAVYTLTGDLSGAGGLTKAGAGTLVLPTVLSQTGGLTVSQGLAIASPTSAAGKMTVTGGTLAINSGAGANSMTVPKLQVQNAASAIRFDLDGTAVPTAPLITVTDADGLTFSGSPKLDVTSPTALPIGTFTLFEYNGAPITSGLSFALPGRTTGGLVYDTANTQINLTVGGSDTIKWTGAVNSNWDVGTSANTGGTNNFQLLVGGTQTNFIATDTVTFNDDATNKDVNLTTSVQPLLVTVDTAATYTFGGAGQMSGSGKMVKKGVGTLVVATDNTYSGGTTVEAGTLQIGSGGTTGSISGNIALNGGKLTFSRSDAATITNTLSGNGTLEISNPGTVTLGSNSPLTDNPLFVGTISLKAGKLSINSYAKLGSVDAASSPTVQFDGGTLQVTANASGNLAQNWVFNAGGGTIEVAGATTSISKRGVTISGSGKMIKTGAGLFSVGNDNSTFSGPIEVQEGVLQLTSNQLSAADGIVVSNGAQYSIRDDVVDDSFFFKTGSSLVLNGAGPNGSGALGLFDQSPGAGGAGPRTIFTNAVTLATNSTVTTVNGTAAGRTSRLVLSNIVSGPGTLIKEGNGLLVLANDNTYTGGTTITAGSLILANTAGTATGTGPVTTAVGTNLGGNGSIAGPLTIAGAITPGLSAGKINGLSATLENTSTFVAEIGAPAGGATPVAGTDYDQLALSGTGTSLNIVSGAKLQVANLTDVVEGQTFMIVDSTGGGAVSGIFSSPGGTPLVNNSIFASEQGALFRITYAAGDVMLTAVPEPTSIALAALASGGLLARRRRTKR